MESLLKDKELKDKDITTRDRILLLRWRKEGNVRLMNDPEPHWVVTEQGRVQLSDTE